MFLLVFIKMLMVKFPYQWKLWRLCIYCSVEWCNALCTSSTHSFALQFLENWYLLCPKCCYYYYYIFLVFSVYFKRLESSLNPIYICVWAWHYFAEVCISVVVMWFSYLWYSLYICGLHVVSQMTNPASKTAACLKNYLTKSKPNTYTM